MLDLNLDAVALLSILTVAGAIVGLAILGIKVRSKIFNSHRSAPEDTHE
ncbi:MAG: hypothetical protein ACJAWL_001057 [Motiliproteus sp.]|jgi:hypothetical protein